MLHMALVLALRLIVLAMSGTDGAFSVSEVCSSLSSCNHSDSLIQSYSHHLTRNTGMKIEDKNDGNFHITSKEENGLKQSVCRCGTEHRARVEIEPKPAFRLSTSGEIEKETCSLVSMTTGHFNAALLFLYLECSSASRHKLKVVRRPDMLSKTYDFDEPQEGDRQIFTGPCVLEVTLSCLYSVNNGYRLYISVYTEPRVLTQGLSVRARSYHYRRKVPSILCGSYQDDRLLCLQNGRNFYYARFIYESSFLRMQEEEWKFLAFIRIADFKISISRDGVNAVFLQENSVVTAKIDVAHKTIHREREMATNATSLTLKGREILLHGRQLEDPFYQIFARETITQC